MIPLHLPPDLPKQLDMPLDRLSQPFCFLSSTPVSFTRRIPSLTSSLHNPSRFTLLSRRPRSSSHFVTPRASVAAAGGAEPAPDRPLQPETSKPILQGSDEVVDKKYKGWRLRIFSSIFMGYACYYFTRNSFTYAAPGLRSSLGFSLEQLGVITSLFPLAYGFSKLLAGILADKFSSRFFMAAGLFVTGIINIAFGMQTKMWAFCALWFANGVFQGFGAPPCAKLLTNWFSKSERGTWWGFWNTSHNTGGFIIPLVAGYCVRAFGWQYGMIVPGMIALVMGLFLFNRLRDDPGQVGLPPVDVYRNDVAEADKNKDGSVKAVEELPLKEKLMKHVFSNPYVWLLALSYFFVYFVRQGVSSWAHIYLLDYKGVANAQEAAFRVSGMEIGGLCGSLISGWASDKMMRGRRIPVIVLWMFGIMASMVGLWYVPVAWRYVNWLAVFAIGFFIYGPQMLIGLAGAEIVDRSAVSSTIGLLGLISYLGASIAGYPLTKIVTHLGWGAYFVALLSFSAIAVVLLLPMWRLGMGDKAKPVPKIKEPLVVTPVLASVPMGTSTLTTGDVAVTAFMNCSTCAGTGEVMRLECGPATPAQGISCRYIETPCPMCIGRGYLPKSENVPSSRLKK